MSKSFKVRFGVAHHAVYANIALRTKGFIIQALLRRASLHPSESCSNSILETSNRIVMHLGPEDNGCLCRRLYGFSRKASAKRISTTLF
jgi:hypothetical protein